MSDVDLLNWARGPGLSWAVALFVLGTLWRLIEIYGLGRKPDLSAPRKGAGASGLATVLRRSLPLRTILERSPVGYIAGYVFHIGLFVVVLGFAQHILLIENLTGVSWPGLPTQVIDFVTVLTLIAMGVSLADRLLKPAKRYLSTCGDWFAWAVTFLPLLTGWLAARHLFLPYTQTLALHILSVELLLVVLPFTKLIHVFTLFGSRWFNGAANGHKGVPV